MKIKLALHWQILIAIILAVIFGLLNPTENKFTLKTYEKFSKNAYKHNYEQSQINKLQVLINDNSTSGKEFIKKIEGLLNEKLNEKQKSYVLSASKYNPNLGYVSWMGDLFMRALKMIIVPLILTSIISGVANIGSAENLGRLGLKTLLYYLSTSTLAILAGLFFVNIINPGTASTITLPDNSDLIPIGTTSFADTLMNIIPTNIFKAFAEQQMLSVIFFSILFGFFITKVNNKSRIFLTNFFNSAFEVMMKITMFIIIFTPFGVFGMIAKTISEQAGQLPELMQSMGLYSLSVLAGLFFHAFIVLPLLLKYIGKSSAWKHFKNMRSALLTAFSTSSSGATLSLTMESTRNKSGVSNKISGFTLPLGATVNMDGTALYEAVAAIFIAQVYGYDLTFVEQVVVVVTALLASIGAAGIPMAGMVMLSVVLSAVGLPLEGIGLIIAVDRILDMFRTSINVWSDSCGAVIIAKSEGETLKV